MVCLEITNVYAARNLSLNLTHVSTFFKGIKITFPNTTTVVGAGSQTKVSVSQYLICFMLWCNNSIWHIIDTCKFFFY